LLRATSIASVLVGRTLTLDTTSRGLQQKRSPGLARRSSFCALASRVIAELANDFRHDGGSASGARFSSNQIR